MRERNGDAVPWGRKWKWTWAGARRRQRTWKQQVKPLREKEDGWMGRKIKKIEGTEKEKRKWRRENGGREQEGRAWGAKP